MSRIDDAGTTKMNSHSLSLNNLKEEDRLSYLDFRARNNRAVQKWRKKQKNKNEEVRANLHFKNLLFNAVNNIKLAEISAD